MIHRNFVPKTVFEIFDFKYVVTLKTGLGVRQGHWKYHHSIERIELPIIIYLFIYLLHGLYRTLSHSQSEESQVRGGHKSVSENPAVKFSIDRRTFRT